ncbi:MAG: hypothetical protein Q8M05_12940 [Rhodoferax sp.]|uniref:hypothetical protein n=1 Tax=Rhodoferax sp. TaxID=50421 RepID=UPI0027311086|nr:hypothetical protein [Rhodoferax sp.]MDP1530280.1 hypothetical protein [Rhodoferax sp.]MDP1943373.1 hypothetical protein [Rhodoferax sp.]
MITHIPEIETKLINTLRLTTEALNHGTAECNALRADAARYRLLRDSDWEMFKPEWLEQHDLFGEGPDQMDEEFDAIIAKGALATQGATA